jgi:2-dehydropantoate 2-reductase
VQTVIVGAGALGTIIAAHLAQAGHDVTLVARGARARWLREHGMQVRGLLDAKLPANVVEDPSTLGDIDTLILGVKTYQMDDALAPIRHLRPRNVFSVANGVMKNEQLVDVYGADRVLGCMADTSGELHTDGVVEFTRNVSLNVGPFAASSLTDSSDVASTINASGLVCNAVDDIASVEWSKFVPWTAMFVLSLLARRTTGQYLSEPSLAGVAVRMMREAGAVAERLEIPLSDDAPMPVAKIIGAGSDQEAVDHVLAVGGVFSENAPTHRMSSLQDLDAGRRIEVEGTVGYLVRKADELGVCAPTLALNYQLVRGIDALQA